VKCWGSSSIGALGTSTKLETTPTQVIGLTSGWEEVVCAYHHACARSSAGAVKCWGYTSAYPLAIDWTPKDVVGLSSDVKALTAGNDHFCALMASGPPRCWGGNQTGQLGDGTTTMAGGWVAPPVIVKDLTNVIRIAGGQLQTCAMRNDGRVFCWGYIKPGVNGQFITYSAVPVQMPGFP
jgi:alpha-tubulin suppressor-like RCC1 family protein